MTFANLLASSQSKRLCQSPLCFLSFPFFLFFSVCRFFCGCCCCIFLCILHFSLSTFYACRHNLLSLWRLLWFAATATNTDILRILEIRRIENTFILSALLVLLLLGILWSFLSGSVNGALIVATKCSKCQYFDARDLDSLPYHAPPEEH